MIFAISLNWSELDSSFSEKQILDLNDLSKALQFMETKSNKVYATVWVLNDENYIPISLPPWGGAVGTLKRFIASGKIGIARQTSQTGNPRWLRSRSIERVSSFWSVFCDYLRAPIRAPLGSYRTRQHVLINTSLAPGKAKKGWRDVSTIGKSSECILISDGTFLQPVFT